MTNDLNDHHDRMVVVEFFLFYDKKKQSLTLSRVPGFSDTLATILSRVSRVCINLNLTFPLEGRSLITFLIFKNIYISQATALAPSTAAELPSRVETRNLALPLKVRSTCSS